MDFTSDSPPQSAQSALWLRSVLSGRSGTPCHQPPDVLSDNDIVRRQLSTSVSGVPLPCPDLAVLGVRPYGCPRLRSRIFGLPLHCVSLRSRVAALRRGGAAAPRTPCRATSALALARAAVRRSSLRARGACPIKRQFFRQPCRSVRCSLRAGLTVKPSAVRHSVCMVGRDPRPTPHYGDYAQKAAVVKGLRSPAATARPVGRLPLTTTTFRAFG